MKRLCCGFSRRWLLWIKVQYWFRNWFDLPGQEKNCSLWQRGCIPWDWMSSSVPTARYTIVLHLRACYTQYVQCNVFGRRSWQVAKRLFTFFSILLDKKFKLLLGKNVSTSQPLWVFCIPSICSLIDLTFVLIVVVVTSDPCWIYSSV